MNTQFFSRRQVVYRARRRFLALATLFLCIGAIYGTVQAQNDIKPILRQFKNYRYGNVNLYRVEGQYLSNARKLLATSSKDAGASCDELDKKLKPEDLNAIVSEVQKRRGVYQRIIEALTKRGMIITNDIDAAVKCHAEGYKGSSGPKIENVYLVTTRVIRGEIPTIIAMISSTKSKENVEDNINTAAEAEIYPIEQLKAMNLEASYGAATMYDYMLNSVVQGTSKNITAEAQGLGNTQLVDIVFGNSKSTVVNEGNVSSQDVQSFIRISEGQPLSYYKPNEIVASYDLISYRHYESADAIAAAEDAAAAAGTDSTGGTTGSGGPGVDEGRIAFNRELPKYGVELRYGLEDINYPSLWSERLALNAIWQNAKLGVILPTSGWASLAASLGQTRQFTHAGAGINGAFDFPIKIIPRSGIFHASMGYVFDDAVESSYRNRAKDLLTGVDSITNDYLVRFNAQLHYTFAITVDDDYLFRFGLGGTVYSVESWYNRVEEDREQLEEKIVFAKRKTETVGGVSGRIEYMAVNTATPYGFGVQYFDEAISGNIWLQVPILPDLAVRGDAKGFIAAFRDPHEWENSSVFIPSVRVIWNF